MKIRDEQLHRVSHLMNIVRALNSQRSSFCLRNRRQQKRGQDGDDGDDHEQFNQGEGTSWFHVEQGGKGELSGSSIRLKASTLRATKRPNRVAFSFAGLRP